MAAGKTSLLGIFCGLVSIGSSIYSYASIPSFTGLKGIFAAAVLVGPGTSSLTALYSMPGLLGGLVVGGILGSLSGKARQGAVAMATVGALVTGALYLPTNYRRVTNIVVNGTAPRPATALSTPAP